MFSGIIESIEPILSVERASGVESGIIRIFVKRPQFFDDLKIGDSVAVNGVCLTVEFFDDEKIQFALGAETIKVLGKSILDQSEKLTGSKVNLERSLRMGDRIHGHLVSGHVECRGRVVRSLAEAGSWILDVDLPRSLSPLVWKKGSITLNGVSLTINSVEASDFGSLISVCLIPETILRTNLANLCPSDEVNVEPDYLARAFQRSLEVGYGHGSSI